MRGTLCWVPPQHNLLPALQSPGIGAEVLGMRREGFGVRRERFGMRCERFGMRRELPALFLLSSVPASDLRDEIQVESFIPFGLQGKWVEVSL